MPLTIDVTRAVDRVLVHLRGEADLAAVPLLLERLWAAAAAGDPVDVHVAEVRFCDGTCLRVLGDFHADLDGAGRTCRLVDVPPRTRRLLQLSGRSDLLSTT